MIVKRKSTISRNPDFDAVADLKKKCADLIKIVEGVGSSRWASPSGRRLKDTHEWCAFYVSARQFGNSHK